MEKVKAYWVYNENCDDMVRNTDGTIKCFDTFAEANEYGDWYLNDYRVVTNVEL